MDLNEWLEGQHAELERFAELWTANHKANPKRWPMKMPPSEWDEHFRYEMEDEMED